jgi:phosphatidate cytidylyltransferase
MLLLMKNTENSKRILTAVLLGGVTLSAILFLQSFMFAIAIGLIGAAGAWEWCQLGRAPGKVGWNIVFILLIAAGVPGSLIFPLALPWIVGVAVLWWSGIAALIILGGRRSQAPGWQAKKWNALLTIFPAAVAIAGLHATASDGRWYVLACLLIVWTTDTFAYMVGRLSGKMLLVPGISPAKTVEGAGGGFVGAAIVGLILYGTLPIEMIFTRLDWMILAIMTAGFSIIGDLTESIYKRAAGVKDSGRIFPGHGGVLDRIDSTLASSPVFVAGILLMTR